ncbi:hypothetical protein ABW636_13800 [Aquimarina sp. 2201CG1-2-11]|uniref:hypothetical protein n=1 Tax=Aquimarina discodermiae TaxID=3231043 RepID=UPI0034628287
MIRKHVLIGLLLACCGLWAQDDGDGQANDWSKYVPKIPVPNSPEAAAIEEFGKVGISYTTGTPNVTVPIYTIQGKELSVPISLSYDASGVKVDQIATSYGLGWNLNYGGAVTRLVRDFPDDLTQGSIDYPIRSSYVQRAIAIRENPETSLFNLFQGYHKTEADRNSMKQLKDGIERSDADLKPDLFNFNANGFSATIAIDYQSPKVNGAYPAYCLEHPDVKAYYIAGTNGVINGWVITTNNGTVYTFTKIENTKTSYVSLENEFHYGYNSAWYLTRIQSANHKDIITYNYTTATYWTKEPRAPNVTIETRVEDCTGRRLPNKETTVVTPAYHISQFNLKNIQYNGDVVVSVSEGSDRTDLPGRRSISSIAVNNIAGEPIKSVQFHYDYFTSNESVDVPFFNNYQLYRLKLRGLDFSEYYSQGLENRIPARSLDQGTYDYSFEYHEELPLPIRTSASQDAYGYYNGSSHSSMVVGDGTFITGTDRTANIEHARQGTLKRIGYPTGGYSRFYYELRNRGGLRVNRISAFDHKGRTANTKKITYASGPSNGSFSKSDFRKSITSNKQVDCIGNGGLQREVTTVYQYHSYSVVPQRKYPNYYSYVEEHLSSGVEKLGKTVYTFYDFTQDKDEEFSTSYRAGKQKGVKIYNERGDLQEEQYFHYSKRIVKDMGSSGVIAKPDATHTTLCASFINDQNGALYAIGHRDLTQVVPGCRLGQFSLGSYTYYSSKSSELDGYWIRLDSTQTIKHHPSGKITSTVQHTYNPNHYQLSSTKTIGSDGLETTRRTYYAHDLPVYQSITPALTTAEINAVNYLKNSNQISTPLYITNSVGNQKTSSIRILYGLHIDTNGKTMALPTTVQYAKGNTALQDKKYVSYDKYGNVKEERLVYGPATSYIWGYKGQYPIASITNKKHADIPTSILNDLLQVSQLPVSQSTAITIGIDTFTNHTAFTNSQVTTFLYKEGVGATRITGPNGIFSTFTYDAGNRLKEVRDQEGYLVSENRYNYSVPSRPDVISTAFNGEKIGSTLKVTAFSAGGAGGYTYKWSINGGSYSVSTTNNTYVITNLNDQIRALVTDSNGIQRTYGLVLTSFK